MNELHYLFVAYLGVEYDAIPMRRHGATLCDFGVCHLGEGHVLATARYRSADSIRIRTNKNCFDVFQGYSPSVCLHCVSPLRRLASYFEGGIDAVNRDMPTKKRTMNHASSANDVEDS
jgi:hypothetical protein